MLLKRQRFSILVCVGIVLSQVISTISLPQAFASGVTSATKINSLASSGSWTASNDNQFSGTEVDNIGIGGYTGFGINDPTAQNGKPAGQYLMLPASVFPYDSANNIPNLILPQGSGNPVFANNKMQGLGFNISGGTYNGQPAYSASDIYTLSGGYVINPQAYYSSGQNVSFQWTSKPTITASLSSSTLIAGQTTTVNVGGSSDTANITPAWGGSTSGGILAYWYFNGVYSSALYENPNITPISVPTFGFAQQASNSTSQTGVIGTTPSFQVTVPQTASGSGELIIYRVDDIDRYAETTVPVTVSGPTLTLSVSPITSQNIGSTFNLTANTTNANGDFVQFTTQTTSGSPINNAGPGTLSGAGQTNQTAISYNPQTTNSYQYQPTATSSQAGSETVTATLISPTAGQLLQKSVTVSWFTPTVSLTPSNQTVQNGQYGTLTLATTNLQSTEAVMITDQSGTATIVNPNTFSHVASYVGNPGQASFSVRISDAVTSQTNDTYVATIISTSTNQAVSGVTPAYAVATFDPPGEGITLTATTQEGTIGTAITTYAGEPITLVATGSDVQADDFITIAELSGNNPTFGSLITTALTESTAQMNGLSQTTWYASIYHTSYAVNAYADSTSAGPQTIKYEATIYNPVTQDIQTATVTVTWEAPPLMITPSTTTTTVNTPVTLLGTTTAPLPSNGAIYIHQSTGTNLGLPPATATSSVPAIQRYYAAAQIEGYIYKSNNVSITWSNQIAVSVTASPSSQNVGQAITFQLTASNLMVGDSYILSIADTGSDRTSFSSLTSITFTANATTYTGFAPQATSYNDLTNEPFTVTLSNANGQQAQAQTTASWTSSSSTGGTSGTPTLSLAASTTTPQQSATSNLTATGSGLTADDTVTIVQESPQNYPNTFLSAATSVNGYEQVTSTTNPFQTTVQNTTNQPGFMADYYATATNPITGQIEAISNSVSIVWGQAAQSTVNLVANPNTLGLGVGSTSTLTATVSDGNPGDYLEVYLVNTPYGSVSVNPMYPSANPPVIVQEIDGTGAASATAAITKSQIGMYTYQIWLWNDRTMQADPISFGTYRATINFTRPQTALIASTMHAIVGEPVTLTATQWGGVDADAYNYITINGITEQSPTVQINEVSGTAPFTASVPPSNGTTYYGQDAIGAFARATDPGLPNGPWFIPGTSTSTFQGTVTNAYPGIQGQVTSNTPATVTFQAEYNVIYSDYYGQSNPYYFGNLNYWREQSAMAPVSVPITITWSEPSITLTASPTTLYAGQASTLVASTPGLPAGDHIVITDGSNLSTLSGSNQVTSTNATFTISAVSQTAATDNYIATIVTSLGQQIAMSNTVAVTWSNSISLTASPTTLYAGQTSTLTATAAGLVPGDSICITDDGSWYSLSGSDQATSSSSLPTSTFFKTTAWTLNNGTNNYTASILNASGQTLATSTPVAVTWLTAPTLQLSASTTFTKVGIPVTLTASGQNYPAGYTVEIIDQSGDSTLQGTNAAQGASNPFATQANDGNAQTVIYQAILKNNQGATAAVSNTVQVNWQSPSYGFLSTQLIHMPGWLRNLNTWNNYPQNPHRTVTDWWAGEGILLKAKLDQFVPVQSVTVSIRDLSYYVVAPLTAPSIETTQLTYDSATGYWTGEIADPGNMQYLKNGSYPVTFTATYTDGTVSVETVDLNILGQWTGTGVNDYFHLQEVLN